MQITLTLTIDPALVSTLLRALHSPEPPLTLELRGEAACAMPATHPHGLPIRALLTTHGLTARQCDVVLLDLQGLTRADIAARCGISPLTVKKYWVAIYAQLGIQRRQSIREWLLAQCGADRLLLEAADLPRRGLSRRLATPPAGAPACESAAS